MVTNIEEHVIFSWEVPFQQGVTLQPQGTRLEGLQITSHWTLLRIMIHGGILVILLTMHKFRKDFRSHMIFSRERRLSPITPRLVSYYTVVLCSNTWSYWRKDTFFRIFVYYHIQNFTRQFGWYGRTHIFWTVWRFGDTVLAFLHKHSD